MRVNSDVRHRKGDSMQPKVLNHNEALYQYLLIFADCRDVSPAEMVRLLRAVTTRIEQVLDQETINSERFLNSVPC